MKNTFVTSSIQNQINTIQQEISLIDILRFFKNAWKSIAIAVLVGLTLSIIYLTITPKQYEAIAQITMAQISVNNNNNSGLNSLGLNIEEPALLISRLSSPTSFTPEVTAACGLQDHANATLLLSKSIRLTSAKGAASVVELKTFGPTPQVALDCGLAVFDLIKTTQSQIVAPYIEEAKAKILDDEERLTKAKDLAAKSDKSGSATSASYLYTRDEVHYLLGEIASLKNIVISSHNRPTRMVAPIYASDVPIAPKKRMVLAVGFFGGVFLGLLIAMGRQIYAKLKLEMAETL